MFFAYSKRSVHILPLQVSLALVFQSYISQVLAQSAKPLATAHELVYLAISPFKQSAQSGALFKVHWLRRFPFTTFLQECPQKGLQCRSYPLLGRDCMLCRTICNPGPSLLFLFQLIVENPHEAIGAGWEREASVARFGTVGIWVTSWCSLFVPSGPTQAWSNIHHFHLMMECCSTCPTLWLGGQMTSSSWLATQVLW